MIKIYIFRQENETIRFNLGHVDGRYFANFVFHVLFSHSLGMKDSWGPLKALVVASAINGFGDIFLCCICHYGIAGAAWATMVSQVICCWYCFHMRGFVAICLLLYSI